jgi:hypothetical protein
VASRLLIVALQFETDRVVFAPRRANAFASFLEKKKSLARRVV